MLSVHCRVTLTPPVFYCVTYGVIICVLFIFEVYLRILWAVQTVRHTASLGGRLLDSEM
jgi:hypothetical protein